MRRNLSNARVRPMMSVGISTEDLASLLVTSSTRRKGGNDNCLMSDSINFMTFQGVLNIFNGSKSYLHNVWLFIKPIILKEDVTWIS